ncbi:hypothetical protein DVA86_23185 [Streptomyces armeniacus]|uniref:Pyrrolo-quinoline quinone repeat domain-containing protein n=1 Tax=Streptomyces armeniacus TaxID=83291 RepID=A0A345XU02_9ACTN|nr:PQQ-binding-like beta-propeller repeat protein [Streptomyces armeniacus]AXK35118.1 hypothetical protein DVA86_23185 [Streptomyces armeniacus]
MGIRGAARVRRVVLSAAVGAVLAATGCTGQDDGGQSDEENTGKAVALSEAQVWSGESALGVESAEGVAFRGDDAVVLGRDGELGVVDADSGTPRWRRNDGDLAAEARLRFRLGDDKKHTVLDGGTPGNTAGMDGRPLITGEGERWSVLARYRGEDGRGVVALSGDDGRPRWRTELPAQDGGDSHSTPGDDIRLLAADARTALVAVAPEDSTEVVTYALDAADGRVLWKREGAWVYDFAGGDTVLGERPAAGDFDPSSGQRDERGWVMALDARSGKEKWSLKTAHPGYRLRGAVEGRAVVAAQDGPSEPAALVLDTTTGRKTSGLKYGKYTCREDAGARLLACAAAADKGLLTLRAGKGGKPVQSTVSSEELLSVDAVHAERVYLEGGLVTGLSGKTRREGLPGRTLAVSDRHAAFETGDGGTGGTGPLKVFRVSAGGEAPDEPEGPGKASVRPLSFTEEPEWTVTSATGSETRVNGPEKDRLELREVSDVRLVGDVLVYSGGTRQVGYAGGRLAGLDAATGKLRWTVDGDDLGEGHHLLPVPDAAGDHRMPVVATGGSHVLVSYYPGTGRDGVAAVSVKDGSVAWKRDVAGGDGGTVRAADAHSYAVESSTTGGGDENKTWDYTVRVYDLKSGELTATRKGVREPHLYDGTVVASVQQPKSRDANTDVVAFTAKTGKEKWRLGDRYRDPAVVHVAGGAAVITHAAGTAVVGTATGRELARTPGQAAGCHGDGPLIVCQAGLQSTGLHPVTVELTKSASRVSAKVRGLPSLTGPASYTAVDDRFFRRAGTSAGEAEPVATVDARGRKAAGELPGLPVALDDDRVCLMDGKLTPYGSPWSGNHEVTVHRRG